MRKRIAALFLCLGLTAAGAACEAKGIDPRAAPDDGPPSAEYVTIDPQTGERIEEGLHLFLNIPFGSTKDEVIKLAKENANLDLAESLVKDLILSNQEAKVEGHEAFLRFDMEKDRLMNVDIRYESYTGTKLKDDYEKLTRQFSDVFDALTRKYGTMQYGEMGVQYDGDILLFRYPFTSEKDRTDWTLVEKAIEGSSYFHLNCEWDNVNLNMLMLQRNGIFSAGNSIHYVGKYVYRNPDDLLRLMDYDDYLNTRKIEIKL